MIDNRTLLIENVSHPCLLGIYIDVFPLDYCPETHFKTVMQFKKIRFLQRVRNIKLSKLSCKRNWLKTCFLAVAKVPLSVVSLDFLSKRISKLAQKYNVKGSKLIAQIVLAVYGYKEIFPAFFYDDCEYLHFEGLNLPAPKYYTQILTQLYGDYMSFPPIEKRTSHHDFTAFWK